MNSCDLGLQITVLSWYLVPGQRHPNNCRLLADTRTSRGGFGQRYRICAAFTGSDHITCLLSAGTPVERLVRSRILGRDPRHVPERTADCSKSNPIELHPSNSTCHSSLSQTSLGYTIRLSTRGLLSLTSPLTLNSWSRSHCLSLPR